MSTSFETFLSALVETGLYSEADVHEFLRPLPADRQPRDGAQLGGELVRQNKLTPFQAEQIAAGQGSSLILGAYVILDRIAQGGMGLVYRAQHRRMKRVVALKVLAPEVMETPKAHGRFLREVEAAAMLTHPNIVIAYDAGEARGQHFLVMEYVDGMDLASHVQQHGPLPFGRACRMVVQAAQGLNAAHQHGVVHRDVKPHNLLLTHSGTVKILDLGLALLTDVGSQHSELTGAGQIIGTVDYMAPEQARNTRHADQRADIYGLGATFWYLLTGQTMYPGQTVVERLLAHQTQPIPKLVDFCPDIPDELQAVFAKMVAKRPVDRYATMQQVIAALEPYQEADSPPSAGPVIAGEVGRHYAPSGVPIGSGVFAASAPPTVRTVTQQRRAAVADGSSPSSNDCTADSSAQMSMAVTVEIPSADQSYGSLRGASLRIRRILAVVGGLAILLLLSVALVKVMSEKGPDAVPDPEGTEVDLLLLVNPGVLGDGQFQDVVVHDDTLVLDATGESPQLWLNFPELQAEEMTIRTQLRVSDGMVDGFFKLILKDLASSSNSEVYAILIQEAVGRRLLIEVSQPFAQLASCSVGENLGTDFIDLAMDVRGETICVLLDGTQVLEALRPRGTKGYVAIAVAGWRAELRRPRAVLRTLQ